MGIVVLSKYYVLGQVLIMDLGIRPNLVNWSNNGLGIRTFMVLELTLGLGPVKRMDMMDCGPLLVNIGMLCNDLVFIM